jgi:hypothetical protein
MYHDSNMLFQPWEAWHILPTYEQILNITKFVSSKFVVTTSGHEGEKQEY